MRSRITPILAAAALALAPGCLGVIDDSPAGPAGTDPRVRPGEPAALPSPTMRRLTGDQYRNTVADLLGEGVGPTGALEADSILNGFVALGASRATISPIGAELYERAALEVADQAMSDPTRRAELVPCTPASTADAACAREFVIEFGRRAWRRPLETVEVDTYSMIAVRSAEVLADFYEGIELAIAALLQSPNFLFRVELGEAAPEGRRRFTSLEMASRLSYALWSSTPDETLLAAAERGELATEDGVRREAERMLASPRARSAVRSFFGEMLRLEALDRLPQDPALYPNMSDTIGAAMRESTLRTIETQLFDGDASYRSLFDSRSTFVDAELADLYGLPAPDGGGFVEVELPADGPRAGLLGHGSVLALLSHSHASSPTVRGKFVREALLCQTIPPPPPDVGELPEPSPDLPTMRERLAEHRANPACASCHQVTDPIGLGLENFDAIGAFRELENGATIDPSGELDGTAFADARGLGEALRDHPELTRCLVRNLYRYASGHVETRAEAPMLDALATAFDDGRLRLLLVELVASDGFRHTGAVE
ncbi:MAG: DUF1592 domain-containing protein [Myxococcota bacterium]|nr:DUF1592 domain-containing protein [Myxococcota bacterium]